VVTRVGDHRAAVRVTDRDDRSVDAIENVAAPSRVAVQIAQRSRVSAVARQVHGHRRHVVSRQPVDSQHQAPCQAPWTSTTTGAELNRPSLCAWRSRLSAPAKHHTVVAHDLSQ
jgi:hypothetical protein